MKELIARRVRSWRKRIGVAVALLLLLGVCGLALLLGLEHRPDWYAPRPLSDTELRDGRMDAMRVIDHVGDQLVARNPFEIVLSDVQLNDWLSGLAEIWPDAARRIPREVIEPFVLFEKGTLRTASRLESNGWRAIISTAYRFDLSPDKKHMIVQLSSARCGAVPIPRSILRSCLKPHLRDVALPSFTLDQLFDGLPVENRFVWPNGKRPFRIDELVIEAGSIRFRIQPL